ncbi:MAG: YbjN domain-containing protein [Mobilicoccus sp.]|nr:YbjN domain-containing protein [Mobilicoccus sp.]
MPTSPESIAALDLIRRFAREQSVVFDEGARPGEIVLTLPGEDKLKTTCSLMAGDRMLSISAFVIRKPDENHVAVYRFLLQRNLGMPGLAYGLDRAGDVFLTGQVPLTALDEDYLDRLLGVVLSGTDEVFNDLLVMGFLESMKREWSWRQTREESLANLEAFRDVLEKEEVDGGRTLTHEMSADAETPADGADHDGRAAGSGPDN